MLIHSPLSEKNAKKGYILLNSLSRRYGVKQQHNLKQKTRHKTQVKFKKSITLSRDVPFCFGE